MAVVDKMRLGEELTRTINQINQQIDEIRKQAENMGIDLHRLRDIDGNWIAIPMLAAKAQCLHALAIVNQRD